MANHHNYSPGDTQGGARDVATITKPGDVAMIMKKLGVRSNCGKRKRGATTMTQKKKLQ